MNRIHRLSLVILILISCINCDQITKSWAKESLASSPPISLLNDSIRIEYSENHGAILSLGANLPSQVRFLFFVVMASILVVLTLVFAINSHSLDQKQLAGLSLVAAGGMGNLLDRIFNDGAAIDFIRLGIGPVRTGVFNVADVAIVAGVSIFLIFSAKAAKRHTNP